ncbi:MAG: glycosyl hydrolase [Bacillota bacterium]|nr:glycosyl hydrolase [Bacillota bacterium]
MKNAPAPLFRDPINEGPTDPTVIYNQAEKSWWIIYTARRATAPCRGVAWVHGTALGVASSNDGGQTWIYRGTLNLEAIEPGHNTYWAPEVIWAEGKYHMYVSYITGVPETWQHPRHILHYTSDNLWDWKYESTLYELGDKAIDACLFPRPEGGWRLFYKNEAAGSHTQYADSDDLYRWVHKGYATNDCEQEGPNVFTLGGDAFMIADMWNGMAVYKSKDLTHWSRQEGHFLSDPGIRQDDTCRGHHADVVSFGNRAYMFYFVHPNAKQYMYGDNDSPITRMSAIQVAMLKNEHGKLTLIRNEPFDFDLSGDQVW